MTKTKNLLLIFTRNPELGKVKTRLAKDVGDTKALAIYKFLLEHTVLVTKDLDATKQVHYSVKIRENDLWDTSIYDKKQQQGSDLGVRMQNAFEQGFKEGYQRIIIIGSDLYDLSQEDLENAFAQLENHDTVIGPALDGGYYLLGLKNLIPEVFSNKVWGTDTVLQSTLTDLQKYTTAILAPRNDVDYLSDIEDLPDFYPFLK